MFQAKSMLHARRWKNPCVYMVERLRRNGRESLVNWMELRRAATLLTGVVLR